MKFGGGSGSTPSDTAAEVCPVLMSMLMAGQNGLPWLKDCVSKIGQLSRDQMHYLSLDKGWAS